MHYVVSVHFLKYNLELYPQVQVMKYRQNDVHGSILPTESTKTGCFCAHTRVHTVQAGKPSMSLRCAKARVVCA